MDIEGTVWRNLKCAWRQDQSVRRNYQNFRLRGSETIEHALVLQGVGLKDFQAAGDGQLLDGTLRWTQAAARRTVRLRQHQRDVVARIKQRRQRTRRKLWSAGKD